MNILHITPHMGGGVGSVIMGWMNKVYGEHEIVVLDNQVKEMRGRRWVTFNSGTHPVLIAGATMDYNERVSSLIHQADIVLAHYWDHPKLAELFSQPIPDCRLVFWCHQNYAVSQKELDYPDLFLDTSPIQGHGRYIWSTGGVDRFLAIQPKPHEGFNIGYVGTVDFKKMHKDTLKMCEEIAKKIPDVHFTFVGDVSPEVLHSLFQPPPYPPYPLSSYKYTLTGKVDDVAPYLSEMDILGYPLRPDHYGTSEQVLGEAMASGVVPVVMANAAEKLIVESYKNGIVAYNEREYIEGIKYLFNNPDERECASEMARKRAKELYSIDTMIQKWDEVFIEMMKQPKRKRETL